MHPVNSSSASNVNTGPSGRLRTTELGDRGGSAANRRRARLSPAGLREGTTVVDGSSLADTADCIEDVLRVTDQLRPRAQQRVGALRLRDQRRTRYCSDPATEPRGRTPPC